MTTEFQMIKLSDLHESKHNVRKHFNPEAMARLTESVRQHNIITPFVVRPNADGYEIAAGHRRFRAATEVGLAEVPAIVREMTDTEFLEVLTIENLQREDIHPLEEADGYRALMQPPASYDVEAIAAKIDKSVAYVYARLKLAELIDDARKAFLDGKITAGHAILLARLQPKDQAEALRAATPAWEDQPISVRKLGDWIRDRVVMDLTKAPFDIADATLVKKAGACGPCPKRAGANPDLFGDIAEGDRCLDRACFAAKDAAHMDRLRKAAVKAAGKTPVVDISGGYSSTGGSLTCTEFYAAGDKTCKHAAIGFIVDPAQNPKLVRGETLAICTGTHNCEVHGGRKASARPSAQPTRGGAAAPQVHESIEAKTERLVRERLLAALLKKTWPVTARDLLGVVEWTVMSMSFGVLWPVALAYGINPKQPANSAEAFLLKQAKGFKQASQLQGMLVLLETAHRAVEDGNDKVLTAFAKAKGVNVAAIEDQVAEELAPKKPAKPATGSAAKKKSTAKKK